jgi:hypothetical protein
MQWYNKEGQYKLFLAALPCTSAYNAQVRDSKDRLTQIQLQIRGLSVWMSVSQAASIARAADDALFQTAMRLSSEEFQQTMRLRDRYNKLVENFNAYNGAVEELMTTVNNILKANRSSASAPRLNFNFVPLKPITCTGNTFAFGNTAGDAGGANTIMNATTTLRCE